MTIIGIMPRGFRHVLESGASPMEVWAPIALDNPDTNFLNVRNARVYDLIGRLKPGRTVEDAQAELGVLTGRLLERVPAGLSRRTRGGTRLPSRWRSRWWATSGPRSSSCSAPWASCC